MVTVGRSSERTTPAGERSSVTRGSCPRLDRRNGADACSLTAAACRAARTDSTGDGRRFVSLDSWRGAFVALAFHRERYELSEVRRNIADTPRHSVDPLAPSSVG